MTHIELNECIKRLQWHKSPGSNGISPNAMKALNSINKLKLLKYINKWLTHPDLTHEEWKSAPLKVLPKKGDLSDPNNWRAIALMDVTSKIVSIF